MGSFKDLVIKDEYRTLQDDDIIESFYVPCLENATCYYRTTSFFSSTLLIHLTKGLCSMYRRGGEIKLICSTELQKEDYEAMEKGYELRRLIENKLIKEFDRDFNFDEKDRLNLLSQLITSGLLEIKIAVINDENGIGIFHEKVGYLEDDAGDAIAFSGSSNDTYSGFANNYESFDVFCSWKNEDSFKRCNNKRVVFNRLWNSREKGVEVFDMPDVIKEKILKFEDRSKNVSTLDEKLVANIRKKRSITEPYLPDNLLYKYQNDAIDNWVKNDYRGIFDMATGTGKTYTASGAICKLYENVKRAFVIICCPLVHLIDQWSEELEIFNIKPISCYGNKKNYEDSLYRTINQFKIGRINFACVLITNSSFTKEWFQELIKPIISETLLLVDEAHNFGAKNTSKTLDYDFRYRLALSATFERYGDEEGTDTLYRFFGEKCITYTLQQAIAEGFLTKYDYHPIVTWLSDSEYSDYVQLSEKISKIIARESTNNISEVSDSLKRLLLKRARIIAGANNKIEALKNILQKYKESYNLLVYCGAVKYGEFNDEDLDEDKKQIEIVTSLMHELKMKGSKFTAEENPDQRQRIKESFVEKRIQALVAIKCLDEGMNIPGIKTAFILASTQNPKEYIQRRGRVLRRAEGKEFAEIYDFITLPYSLEECRTRDIKNYDMNLVKRELQRMEEFSSLSRNPSESNAIIDELKTAFRINIIQFEKKGDYLL